MFKAGIMLEISEIAGSNSLSRKTNETGECRYNRPEEGNLSGKESALWTTPQYSTAWTADGIVTMCNS